MESNKNTDEEWYADVQKRFGLSKEYLEEAYKESLEESEKLYNEAKSDDLLDLDLPVSIPLKDGLHSIRNAEIREEKLYLDEKKKNIRYSYQNKTEGNIRNEAIILLNPNDKRLSEIITQLPYGLIDKQATGIGATYSEMHSKRDAIIVVPTRALGENKCGNNPAFLYVGTRRVVNKVTTNEEIKNYLNDVNIEFKKIVVVADSLKKVIDNIQGLGIDVYRSYFLMVDEIDTIQSDNHYRPQLSNVIDYYYKFKLQRRALVSATVKDFSDPRLQGEPLTTIKREEAIKRNIILAYTNNINELLIEGILKISSENPEEKILIAYNSITDIQLVINRLPEGIKNRCGILCSETNHNEKIEPQYIAEITPEDRLSHEIVFMTCAYFAGLDIKDRCHLITISTVEYDYTMLSINRMIQIAGRCRNGLLSDFILYDTTKFKKPFYYLKNYKKGLINKADKIVRYFTATKELANGDEDLKIVFNRIEPIIIQNSYQDVFRGQPIPLTRKNTLDENFEISYFNIDVLYEQMVSYSKLYSSKENLYKLLRKEHNVTFTEKLFDEVTQETTRAISDENKRQRVQSCIDDLEATISTSTFINANLLLERELDGRIKASRTFEKEFYSRVKELYRYLDFRILNQRLLEICTEKNNVKYKGFKNAVFFWALDETHPFKQMIKSSFKIGSVYPNEEIQNKLLIILTNQLFRRSTITMGGAVRFLNSILETERISTRSNTYKIKGYVSKLLTDLGVTTPISTISVEKEANRFFIV